MLRTLLPIALCTFLACHAPPVRPTPVAKTAAPERAARLDPHKKFTELSAGAQVQRGLFDVYQKEGQIYLAVPKAQLNKDFLLATHIDRGAGSLALFAGHRLRIRICEFRRRGETVYLLQRSSYFTTAAGSSWEQSVEQSYAPTVLDSAKVEATRPDGAVLFPVQGWLTSDLTNVGARVQADLKTNKASRPPDRSRSYVESVRAFPDNVNFAAILTFAPSDDGQHSFVSDGDGRYLPVGVSYTLARLPASPMSPRLADDRIGLRVTLRREPGKVINPIIRYAYRWRLRPGQPLTFYLDPSIPAEYRPYVISAINSWDRALTAAGWEHMIHAEPLPDGTDAGDLRYPTVRWGAQVHGGFNGVTSDVVDPRTGEILGSTIVLDGDHLIDDRVLRLMLVLQGRLRPDQVLPPEYVGQMIKKTTMHEIGHALGLEHNFAATLATTVDQLADAEWVRAHGVANSVMDYPAVNLPPSLKTPLGANFPIFNQDIGPADIWAIRYAYERDDSAVRELAQKANQKGFRYAWHSFDNDDDDPDPTVGRHDLGGEPLEWMRRRLNLFRELLSALPGPLPGEGGRAADLTEVVDAVLWQYAQDAKIAVRYLGGHQLFFDHAGDPDRRPNAVAIPKAQQREALDLLADAVFRDDAVPISAPLRAQMGVSRFAIHPRDPIVHALTVVPHMTLEAVTAPAVLNRMHIAESRFGAESTVTMAELFDALDRMIFSDPAKPPSRFRRELQREYVDRLASFVLTAPPDLPKDARALARGHLLLLRQQLSAPRKWDVASAAHRSDLTARIARVLDAHVVERNP